MTPTPPVQGQRKAATYLVGERALRMLIGFFVHTWMARTYSPEDFGFISFTVKSVGVYFTFGMFGVDEVIIKMLVATNLDKKRDVLRTAFLIRLFMGLMGWITLLLVTGSVSGFGSEVWLITVSYGLIIIIQAFTVYELPFMSQMSMGPIVFSRNISYLIGAASKIMAFVKGWSRNVFVGLYAIEETLWKALIYIKAMQWGFTGGNWDSSIAKSLWKSGALAFMASFVVLFDQRLPFLFLESAQNTNWLGSYSVVISLMDMALLLPISLAMALFPKVAQAREEKSSTYLRERQSMSNWLVWSGLAFAIGIYFCAPFILTLLYKGKYDNALSLLRGMGLIAIWNYFNLGRFKWFALEESLNDWLALSVLSLIIQAAALKYFVPTYGLEGIVVSIIVAQVSSSILLIFRPSVRKSLRVLLGAFIPKLGYN